MAIMQDNLVSKENVIEQLVGIKYQDENFNCIVTNSKVILFRGEEQENIEIDYDSIDSISFEKEWYIDLIYVILFSFALAFFCLFSSLIINLPLNLPPPQVWPPADSELLRALLYPGIVFTILGIGTSIVYFKRIKFSLLISGPNGDFRLFSNHEMLFKLNQIIKNMKSGREQPLKQDEIFGFPNFLRVASNIAIGASIFLLAIIGWEANVPSFRNLFFIPFLLLIIGFIMALMSYNEKKIKKNYFKGGILLIFLGLNCIWFQIYMSTIPVIGFAVLFVGAILFFDSYSIK